ncbi:hypothetical protein CDL15_Pgr027098 [Punica granatum]|uniref:Uncharacterized protein n=1 Tax=Punica granatum TaxID=22663 RepID=A0A218XI18_PUNGR|nr:hypothetical protein CDL15_Pgr027098 [Punica granatum]
MDLKFQRLEGCFEDIADQLDAVSINAYRNRNDEGQCLKDWRVCSQPEPDLGQYVSVGSRST